MNNNDTNIQEDEIDLRELFKTLMKRKKIIMLFTAVVTVAALVYAYFKTPIYEVKSNVQIGFIGTDLIDEPDTLVKKLNIIFNIEDKISRKGEYVSEVTSISTNKKIKNFIEIKTEAISNEEALNKNKEVLAYIRELYRQKIEQYLSNVKNQIEQVKRDINLIDSFQIKNIEEQIKSLEKQTIFQIDEKINFLKSTKLKAIDSKISFHTKKLLEYTQSVNQLYKNSKTNTDSAVLTISSIQMVNYQNLILNSQNAIEDLKIEKEILETQTIKNLEIEKENIKSDTIRKLQHAINVDLVSKKIQLNEKISQLKYSLTEENVKNCDVVGEYIVHDYAIKPKKKLIVAVAFVTGLILSIFLVFFLEFIRNERSESTDLK